MGDFGFLQWKDTLDWTEDNKEGLRALKKESANFESYLKKFSVNSLPFKRSYNAHTECIHRILRRGSICIRPLIHGTIHDSGYEWKNGDLGKWHECETIDHYKSSLYVTHDHGRGTESYRISRIGKNGWTYIQPVSSLFAIHNSRIYCLEEESPLRYTRLISLSLNGDDRIVHYEERNESVSLSLKRAYGGAVFLKGYNSGLETLYFVNDGCMKLSPEANYFFPVGAISGKPVYFSKPEKGSQWTLHGCKWKLNIELRSQGIEYCSIDPPCVITKARGTRTVWSVKADSQPQKRLTMIGACVPPLLLASDSYKNPKTVLWTVPGRTLQHLELTQGELLGRKEIYALSLKGVNKSWDNHIIAWNLLAPPRGKPRGLLLIAYAAYDFPLSLNTTRWRPWIEEGWAVALLFLRGGGDGNEIDADAGRGYKRPDVVKDLDIVCQHLQGVTGCGPKNTCLYGRSAGGLLLGGIASKYPNGERIGILYAEVPYVDLLKSASNSDLPLTRYDYDEFADPRKSPLDFYKTLQMSPVHMLSESGAPGIKVLCRTAINDKQVYKHEPLKWIIRLRGHKRSDSTKLLHMSSNGHYTPLHESVRIYAEDLTIINSWI